MHDEQVLKHSLWKVVSCIHIEINQDEWCNGQYTNVGVIILVQYLKMSKILNLLCGYVYVNQLLHALILLFLLACWKQTYRIKHIRLIKIMSS